MARCSGSSRRIERLPAALARSYERYLKIALAFPGTEALPPPGSAWHRAAKVWDTPWVKVRGKLLSRWRTEAEGGLAIRCDFLDRQIQLQARPDVFFVTDHYLNYPWILVRLEQASQDLLSDVTERAWRFVAPAKLIKKYDSSQA